MLRTLFVLSTIVTVCLVSGPAAHAEERAASPPQIYQQTLKATAWVRTDQGEGTGWLVDRSRRLLLTNCRVVGNQATVTVVFPEYKNGVVIAERGFYEKNGKTLRGKVVARDAKRDLALVSLPMVPKPVVAMKLSTDNPRPGERIHSIGNPGGDVLWKYTAGAVRQVYWGHVEFGKGQKVSAHLVETQSASSLGDSGGPVVNDRGELIGVNASFTQDARLVGQCIAVREVKQFLAKARK